MSKLFSLRDTFILCVCVGFSSENQANKLVLCTKQQQCVHEDYVNSGCKQFSLVVDPHLTFYTTHCNGLQTCAKTLLLPYVLLPSKHIFSDKFPSTAPSSFLLLTPKDQSVKSDTTENDFLWKTTKERRMLVRFQPFFKRCIFGKLGSLVITLFLLTSLSGCEIERK